MPALDEGDPMMHLNIFMTRQMVIEKYGIAPDLEQEVFAVLKPVGGSGINAQYLESRVDQQLHQYFEQKNRLRGKEAWSYPNKEDLNVIDVMGPEGELAGVVREIFQWLKPRWEVAFPEQRVETATGMLTPQQVAQRLRVHVQTVMKWCRQGDKASCPLSASKLAGKWLIPKEAVDAALRRAQVIHGRVG